MVSYGRKHAKHVLVAWFGMRNMENTNFDQYSPVEFVQEFFSTFFEIVSGIIQALFQAVISFGPLNVLIAAYVFLLLVAVVSELKKYRRKLEDDNRAFEAALMARRQEEQRRQVERDERINKSKERDVQKKKAPRIPAATMMNYNAQKFTPNSVNRGR